MKITPALAGCLSTAAVLALFFLAPSAAFSGNATWNLNPASGDWNTATNWTPMTVPNASADTATFDQSNTTSVSISANTEVNGITFTPSASAYGFGVNPGATLTLSGSGITNNSGATQSFAVHGSFSGGQAMLQFSNSSTAGNANIFNGQGAAGFSSVSFSGSSTAGTASVFGLSGTSIGFSGNSSAGNAKITTNDNNSLSFSGSSTAGNATIGLADNTFLGFGDSSTAGNANIGSLGIISFGGSSTGGTAQINLGSDGGHTGLLQIDHDVTIGSLAGITMFGGNPGVSLGANTLTVGSNNLSTTYQGTIGGGGGLTKIGTGTLTLAGTGTLATNTYTGATNVNGGVLQVDGSIASNTFVNNGGTLGGTGTIKNNVTVNNGGTVSPGDSPGTLTIQGALTLNSGATFKFELNSSTAVADKVIANGVTIDGAEFSFTDLGNSMLAVGMIFVVIDDTAMSPITGTFANLPDQSLVTIGSNTFLVNYEGGDGNNLTIQVVPEPSTWLLVVFVSLILVIRRFGILSERRFAQMKGNVS